MKAPYRPGDGVQVLHTCDGPQHGGGTALATLTVDWCKALATAGRWRVHVTRCDGSALEAEVDAHGRDVHGYVRPAPATGGAR